MSEEKNEFNVEDLVSKISAEVQSKVSSQFEDVKTKMSGIHERVNSLSAKATTTEEEDDDDLDDYPVASKKDLKKLIAEQISSATQEITKNVTGSLNESLNVSQKQKEWDARTGKDFPMLVEGSPLYSKEFLADVQKEIIERKKDGDTEKNPRLVYDSAAKVLATNSKYQKISLDEQIRINNNQDSQFTFRNNSRSKTSELTSTQMYLAKRLGKDPEKVKEYLKKRAN